MYDYRITQSRCIECKQSTDHMVLWELVENDDRFGLRTVYSVHECCGCHMRSYWKILFDNKEKILQEEHYPSERMRVLPQYPKNILDKFPVDFRRVMVEVYSNLSMNSLRLCTMGARAMLDMLMTDMVGDQGVFKEKFDRMVAEDHITKKQRIILETALDLGHAAAHRGFCPSIEDLHAVLDMIESIINQTYVFPVTSQGMKDRTPPRPKKK